MNTAPSTQQFKQIVWKHFRAHGRSDLPWRINFDPYCVYVSEVMLQQTQVERVRAKFTDFTTQLPSWSDLSNASTAQVLSLWQGLGYNRRGLWLHEAARRVMGEFDGSLPQSSEALRSFKGIGANTAGSIMAFAFNTPVVFIETNIRRAYIYHFFNDQEAVPDQDILQLVDTTLDQTKPREWYWALMDYGSYLAKAVPNPNRQSKHYTRQSEFKGSLRQVRGQVIRELTNCPQTADQLQAKISDKRLGQVLELLANEQFIAQHGQNYKIREVT